MLRLIMKWLLRMELSDSEIMKLSRLSRTNLRDQHHFRSHLLRRIARSMRPRKGARKRTFVVEYDSSLFLVDTDSRVGYSILFKGRHQAIILDTVLKVAQPGSVCIDIGANIGALTIPMARAVGPTGKVIAVEPQPLVAQRLRQNLAINNFRNATVVEAAVGRVDGPIKFYTFPEGAWNQGISSLTATDRATTPIEVQGVSGRTLLAMAGNACHFIKIDVEGHELAVLRELTELISKFHPAMIFEYQLPNWESAGYKVEDAITLLQSWGYDMYGLSPDCVITPLPEVVPDKCDIFCVWASR